VFDPHHTPTSSPPITTHFQSTPYNSLLSIEESQSVFGEPSFVETHQASSTVTMRQGPTSFSTDDPSIQHLLTTLKILHPQESEQQHIAYIYSTQTRNAAAASTRNLEDQFSRRATSPIFGGDPKYTSVQSPRLTPAPIELTPLPTPRDPTSPAHVDFVSSVPMDLPAIKVSESPQ